MRKLIEYNINEMVKVKLTEKGGHILTKRHAEMQELLCSHDSSRKPEPFELKLDEEGFYHDQMWCIMRDFGKYMRMGADVPFETTIILDTLKE